MQPKIGYLIDNNAGWGDEPDWTFYTEEDVPAHMIRHTSTGRVKRIVYWEIDNGAA